MLKCPICGTQNSKELDECENCGWTLSLLSSKDKTAQEIFEIAIAWAKKRWQEYPKLTAEKTSESQPEVPSSLNKLEKQLRETIERVSLLEKFEGEYQQSDSELQELINEREQLKKQLGELASENKSIKQELDIIRNTTTDKSQLESKLSSLSTQLQEQITSLKTHSEEQLQSQLSQIKSNTEQEIHDLQTKLEEFEDYIKNLFKNKNSQVKTKDTNSDQEQSDMVTQILPSFEEHKLIKELLREYNQNCESNSLAAKIIEVSETQKSISDRSVGASQEVILEKKPRGMYGIITKDNYHYLVPSTRFRITDNNYKTVQALFKCDGYQKGLSENFKLAQPARVSSLSSNQQWQLEESGVLEFELD